MEPNERRALTDLSGNLTVTAHAVTREHRAIRNWHCGGALWLAGLSGAGESTLPLALNPTPTRLYRLRPGRG
jgi:bifunctional enzyme CysN/CysC